MYDIYIGELIGYCNLDVVGNELLELEKVIINFFLEFVKCMFVIMVRGVVILLKFLLVGFVINSIIVDFLYLIIWKVVFILYWKL